MVPKKWKFSWEMELHVGAQGLVVGFADGGDHGGEEPGVGVDDGVGAERAGKLGGSVDGFEKGLEADGADGGLELGHGLRMVDGGWVAALGVGHGGFGEPGLEGEDVFRVDGGLVCGLAGEDEHLGDEVDVLVAELLVLVAGAGVVVALGKAEAALIEGSDLPGCVLEVLHLAEGEEDVDAHALEFAGEVGESGLGGAIDLTEQGLDGSEAFLVDERGVEAGGVVVADLLLVGGTAGRGLLVLGEDAAELLVVDVVEDVELVDAALVGGDGVVGGEAAAGELVEVLAGVGGGVDGGEIEGWSWEVRRCGSGRGDGLLGVDPRGYAGGEKGSGTPACGRAGTGTNNHRLTPWDLGERARLRTVY
jgi:hypothetical protein